MHHVNEDGDSCLTLLCRWRQAHREGSPGTRRTRYESPRAPSLRAAVLHTRRNPLVTRGSPACAPFPSPLAVVVSLTSQGGEAHQRHNTVVKRFQRQRNHTMKRGQSRRPNGAQQGLDGSYVSEASPEEWIVFNLLEAMVKAGANVNHRNKAGYTPLLAACQAAWSVALVEMLLTSYDTDVTMFTTDVRARLPTLYSLAPFFRLV